MVITANNGLWHFKKKKKEKKKKKSILVTAPPWSLRALLIATIHISSVQSSLINNATELDIVDLDDF